MSATQVTFATSCLNLYSGNNYLIDFLLLETLKGSYTMFTFMPH